MAFPTEMPLISIIFAYRAVVGNSEFRIAEVSIRQTPYLFRHKVQRVATRTLAALLDERVYLSADESAVGCVDGELQHRSITRYAADVHAVWSAEIAETVCYEMILV